LTVPRDYPLFIVVVFLGESAYVADFNPYCSGVIKEKMKCAGYWRYLPTAQISFKRNSMITAWKSHCNISWQDILMELVV